MSVRRVSRLVRGGIELDLTPEVRSQPPVNDSGFRFNLEARLQVDDEPGPSGMTYFVMKDNDNKKVEGCHRAGLPPTNIIDISEVVQSYVHKNMNMQRVGAFCTGR